MYHLLNFRTTSRGARTSRLCSGGKTTRVLLPALFGSDFQPQENQVVDQLMSNGTSCSPSPSPRRSALYRQELIWAPPKRRPQPARRRAGQMPAVRAVRGTAKECGIHRSSQTRATCARGWWPACRSMSAACGCENSRSLMSQGYHRGVLSRVTVWSTGDGPEVRRTKRN